MVYFCADDYGLCKAASIRIQECIDQGVLNKVSVFPNFDTVDLQKIQNLKDIRISLHLNLVEGKCMANAGNFRHTFGGLLLYSFLQRRKFEEQVYQEIKTQVLSWKSILPQGVPFCVDSHQHTHMIPAVFRVLLRVLQEEKIKLEYLCIPAEPILPYLKTPSLYLTYSPINIVKQWLLNFLWLFNKKQAKKEKIPTAYFMGILFSGKMDEKRVSKILPKYVKMAEKDGKDIEVLFHPGFIEEKELDKKEIAFEKFYLSENRKTEYDSVIKISERSVL